MDKKLQTFLEENGYSHFKEIPGKGICALQEFIFTTGLVVGITEYSYEKRYCYENFEDALQGLEGFQENMKHPLGPWIKLKGVGVDELNPEFGKENIVDNNNNNSLKNNHCKPKNKLK